MATKFVQDYPELFLLVFTALFVSFIGVVTFWVKAIRMRLVNHIKREEEVTWPELQKQYEGLSTQLHHYHLETVRSMLLLEKRLEVRIVAFESKIPNGELKEALEILRGLKR